MSSPEKQRDMLWLSALREVAHHFSKIGEVVAKCAEDSERLMQNGPTDQFPPNPAPPTSRPPHRDEDPHHRDRPATWPTLSSKPMRAPQDFPRYNYRPDRPAPPPSYPMYYPLPPEYVPVRGAAAYQGSEAVEHDQNGALRMSDEVMRLRHKRRASLSPAELDSFGRDPNGHLLFRGARPGKRVRINWSESENDVFFDTITKHSNLEEASVLREIVKALDGSRNWVQVKGHFRNLVVVGRIVLREGPPKRWVVLDEGAIKKTGGKLLPMRMDSKSDDESYAKKGGEDRRKKGGGGSGSVSSKERAENEENHVDYDLDEDEDYDGGADDADGDEDYVGPEEGDGDVENGERAENDRREADSKSVSKGSDQGDAEEEGASRTRPSRSMRAEGRAVVQRSPRQRSLSELRVQDKNNVTGRHTVPPRKQTPSTNVGDGAKAQPLRRGREMTKRRSGDYRSGAHGEGRYFNRSK